MAVVGDLVRNLVVLIFLNALLEMLMPQKSFRPYIRLVTGLIIVLMVVGTITALMGRVPQLEPVATGSGVRGPLPPGGLEGTPGDVDGSYRRQVLQQCREGLEKMIAREIASAGEWELAGAEITLNEAPESGAFGEPEQVYLRVRAAGNSGGSVKPIAIDPVDPGAAAEGAEGRDRLPELERSLADLLEIAPDQVEVTVEE